MYISPNNPEQNACIWGMSFSITELRIETGNSVFTRRQSAYFEL